MYTTFQQSDDPPWYDPGAVGYEGKLKGMKQLLYELGWWKGGMTMDGKRKRRGSKRKKELVYAPKRWQPYDVVVRNEIHKDVNGNEIETRVL